jgi:hypothetical protein
MCFCRSKPCGGCALSVQGKEPVKEPAVRGNPAVLAQALRSSGCPSGSSVDLTLFHLPTLAVTQRGGGRTGVRRHTRTSSGSCRYRCGGLSVAEVRTLVVLSSRTVFACTGGPGEGSCSCWMRFRTGWSRSPLRTEADPGTAGRDYHAVIIVGSAFGKLVTQLRREGVDVPVRGWPYAAQLLAPPVLMMHGDRCKVTPS